MDKLTAIRTFIVVAETRKFSRAAELLGIPRARVSQRVHALENVLGVRLIHRTTQTMRLTPEGELYFAQCRDLVTGLDDLENSLSGDVRRAVGMIRVEMITSIARHIVAPALKDFQTRYPDIGLWISSSDQVRSLPGSGIDCAVRGGVLEDSSFISQKLCDVHFGLYCEPELAGQISDPQDLLSLMRLQSPLMPGGRPQPWRLTREEEVFEVAASQNYMFDDTETAIAAAATGAGVVVAPHFLVDSLCAHGQLQPVLPDWCAGIKPLYIVYPTVEHLPLRLRAFIEWMKELAHRHPNLAARQQTAKK